MTTTYMFNKTNRTNIMSMQRQAVLLIQSFFSSVFLEESQANNSSKGLQSLVGKPMFTVTSDKVIIQLFYFSPLKSISNTSVIALGDALTRCWGRTVELRLIRLNHPALDSSIFAQYLSMNAGKYSFTRILDMLKSTLPTVLSTSSVGLEAENSVVPTSHITGVKIKLSGRLTTQRSGPRQTVQAGRIGSSAKSQLGTVDYNHYTSKNKLGAFTMKVWISQQNQ